MGDRGNIIIEPDGDCFTAPLFMYTHWSGSEIKTTLQAALAMGRGRWTDGSYLARIIFSVLTRGEIGETGFGLSNSPGDNEHDYLCVNIATKTVRLLKCDWESEKEPLESEELKRWTFEEYIAADFSKGEEEEENE